MYVKGYGPLFAFFCLTMILHGQTTVVSDKYLVESRGELYTWTINGTRFHASAEPVVIYPHTRGLDTIVFYDDLYAKRRDTIYSHIPAGKNYNMSIGCCDAGFDIYEKNKFDTFYEQTREDDSNFDSLFMASKENGQVKFIIHNKPANDTLICLYTDFSGLPEGEMFTNQKASGWTYPSKGFYSTSNDYIVFAKKKAHLEWHAEGKHKISWDSPDFSEYFQTLTKFQVRIFNDEKWVIHYDYPTRKTWIEILK